MTRRDDNQMTREKAQRALNFMRSQTLHRMANPPARRPRLTLRDLAAYAILIGVAFAFLLTVFAFVAALASLAGWL